MERKASLYKFYLLVGVGRAKNAYVSLSQTGQDRVKEKKKERKKKGKKRKRKKRKREKERKNATLNRKINFSTFSIQE